MQLILLMFAELFHVLSMLLPSKLLTLPKVSENMEININSPRVTKEEVDSGTSSIPAPIDQGADQSVADQGTPSSTASSPSDRVETAEAEIDSPQSLTPESSVESEDSSSRTKILNLSRSWTEASEKVG